MDMSAVEKYMPRTASCVLCLELGLTTVTAAASATTTLHVLW